MHAYWGRGDQRKALVENLKGTFIEKLKETPIFHQRIIIEYLPKEDVTLLYFSGHWAGTSDEALAEMAYDKEWLQMNFLGFGNHNKDIRFGIEYVRLDSLRKIHTLGEYLKMKPLYRVSVCNEHRLGRGFYPESFNTLDQLRRRLKKEGWTYVADGDYSYEGDFRIDYHNGVLIKDISLYHVLTYESMVGFERNYWPKSNSEKL